MTNIEIRTKEIYNQLSKSEKMVADYILNNISDLLNLSIDELSESAGVSKPSVVRFSKSLGYSGYKELKKSVISDFNDRAFQNYSSEQYADIRHLSGISMIKNSVKTNSIKSIEDTISLLDDDTLKSVVSHIIKAYSIRLFGTGASSVVAEDLYYKLLRIGKNVCHSSDLHIQLTYAATLTENDVAIIFSYSGLTKEMIEIMNIAKRCRAKTVAVTKYSKSDFVNNADYVIHTVAPEVERRSGAMVSRIAQLVVVDLLFSAVASQDYEHVKDNLQKSFDTCNAHKKPFRR